MKKTLKVIFTVFCCLLLLIGVVAYFAARWYCGIYGDVGFDSIVYTLLSDLGGTDSGLIIDYLTNGLIPAIIVFGFCLFILFAHPKKSLVMYLGKKLKLRLYPFNRVLKRILALLLAVALLISAGAQVKLFAYIQAMTDQSILFPDYYADPKETQITFPEEKQNLIYIFLESVEPTFTTPEKGGGIPVDAIPELYDLAQENINFSNTDSFGGGYSLTGGTWTIGAMTSATTGIPLKVPSNVGANTYGDDKFLPGAISLSDILHENGYYQSLMVGSNASFGNRRNFYEQHGTDMIYDLYTAREDGIIPEDYYVWWGFEDLYLYEYAKQELLEISQRDEPFAFTMLTVDTHATEGYVCEKCDNQFPAQYENVLACASRQLNDFVAWLQEQDFYENTTVMICGDHVTMAWDYISDRADPEYTRTVYNCILNSRTEPIKEKNRVFSTLDLFPTTLAAIGCEIEGDRLGLGTDLFSETPTLCEEMGMSEFNYELSKSSSYYMENFYFTES